MANKLFIFVHFWNIEHMKILRPVSYTHLEEVERDYIEFRKEIEEEEHRKSEKWHVKNSDNVRDQWINWWTNKTSSTVFLAVSYTHLYVKRITIPFLGIWKGFVFQFQ